MPYMPALCSAALRVARLLLSTGEILLYTSRALLYAGEIFLRASEVLLHTGRLLLNVSGVFPGVGNALFALQRRPLTTRGQVGQINWWLPGPWCRPDGDGHGSTRTDCWGSWDKDRYIVYRYLDDRNILCASLVVGLSMHTIIVDLRS